MWINAPLNILRAEHADWIVTDLSRSRTFDVEQLGYVLSEETSDALYLRGYEENVHHCLVLRQGPVPIVDHIAYRVASPEDLDLLARFYDSLQCPVRWVMASESRQTSALRVQDPLGFTVEFFHAISQV